MENRGEEDRGLENYVKDVYAAIRQSLKPTIARVNGYAIGGGNHMAYFCDFTIASEAAIFGQNGPRVASPAQGWIVSYLVRVLGAKRARDVVSVPSVHGGSGPGLGSGERGGPRG